MTAPRRLTSGLSALGLLVAALLGTVVLAAPAQAAERVVTITAEGVRPQSLQVAKGDTLVFVNEDAGFRYQPRSTGGAWDFDRRRQTLVPLGPGERWTVPGAGGEPFVFAEAGTYTYTVFEAQQEDTAAFRGAVVLPAPASPSAAPPAPAAPRPAASPAPAGAPAASAPASPAPAPAPTGGAGTAVVPPLPGGFGTLDTTPAPPAEGLALPPALAPPPPLPGEAAGPGPLTAPVPTSAPLTAPAVRGDLPGAATSRALGLPAALAVVLAAGTASLLVRLLLAEPAARRARTGLGAAAPVATVD